MKSGMLFSCLRRARLLGSLAIRWNEPTHMSTISSMYTPSYITETTGKKITTSFKNSSTIQNIDPLPYARRVLLRVVICRPFTTWIKTCTDGHWVVLLTMNPAGAPGMVLRLDSWWARLRSCQILGITPLERRTAWFSLQRARLRIRPEIYNKIER